MVFAVAISNTTGPGLTPGAQIKLQRDFPGGARRVARIDSRVDAAELCRTIPWNSAEGVECIGARERVDNSRERVGITHCRVRIARHKHLVHR